MSKSSAQLSVPAQPVLCSSCFDQVEWAQRILAIIPKSDCDICAKRCLGYKTEKEVS